MSKNEEPAKNDRADAVRVQLRTLRKSLARFDSQFQATVSAVERMERLHTLFRARRDDPEALPQFMVECGMVDKETCAVLCGLNRLILASGADRAEDG